MMDVHLTIYQLIKAFLDNARLLATLFEADKQYLADNNIALIEQNNQKKIAVNETLLVLMHTLVNHPNLSLKTGTVFERLNDYIQSLSLIEQQTFHDLLARLKDEVFFLSQMVQVNRTIIHENMNYIKALFSSIRYDSQVSEPSLYSSSGLILSNQRV